MWVRLQVKISDDMESGHSEEAGLTAFTLVQYENKRVGLIIAIHPGVLDVSSAAGAHHPSSSSPASCT